MSMCHRDLFQYSVAILDTFSVDDLSVDSHVASFFSDKDIEEVDRIFIVEVFSGCVRFRQALNVVVKAYYNAEGRTVLRSEENVYTVLTYLLLFRLEELGIDEFEAFVKTYSTKKMHPYLKFVTTEKNVLTWMKDSWLQIYDSIFVQQELLLPLQKWLPKLSKIVEEMKKNLDNKNKPKPKVIQVTDTKPFNLAISKPRYVTVPEEIPTIAKAKEVPGSTYTSPPERGVISQKKIKNRRQAEELLLEASKLQPTCATSEKSEKVCRKMDAIVQERDARLQFEGRKALPAPTFTQNLRPIKLNAASILREWKLYQDKENKEMKKLEALESGAFDASSFLKWQEGVQAQDLATELADVERRRLSGKLSYEEAILARRRLEEDNRAVAITIKEETAAMMAAVAEERESEEEAMRRMVEAVLACHDNAKKARKLVEESKQKIVQDMSEEAQEMKRRVQEQAEVELRRKMELIAEIRAMEASLGSREKLVDLASVPGHGFLDEMSIAELRTRLSYLKETRTCELEEKRDSILEVKEEKDRYLMETLERISRHRAEMSRTAAIKLEEKKEDRGQKKPPVEVNDPKLDQLQSKLEERRAQRLQLQKKDKRGGLTAPSGATNVSNTSRKNIKQKRSLEDSRWAQLQSAQERTDKLQSEGALQSQSARKLAARTAILS